MISSKENKTKKAREKKIDLTLAATMDASDAPAFTDPCKKPDYIASLFGPLEALVDKSLPASAQKKIENAAAALDNYNSGEMTKEKAAEVILGVTEDREIQAYIT